MPDEDASLLDAAAQELYGLPPGEFTARRDELAAAARTAGDTAQAKEIKALRRPTAAAWLTNALVRHDGEPIRAVLAFGEEARSGAAGDAADLLRRRRGVLQAAVREARDIARAAGESFADAVLRDVETTLDAAIADDGAASAVRSGRLQRSLQSGGFDAVDLDGAVGGAPVEQRPAGRPTLTVIAGGRAEGGSDAAAAPSRARGGSAARGTASGTAGAASAARARDVSREETAAETALADLDRASQTAQQAHSAVEALQQEIEALRARRAELERELASAQEAQSAAQQRAARARRTAVDADRRLAAAQRRATAAQQRLDAARQTTSDG